MGACPNCDSRLPTFSQVCPQCGWSKSGGSGRYIAERSLIKIGRRKCPSCGASIKHGYTTCRKCGGNAPKTGYYDAGGLGVNRVQPGVADQALADSWLNERELNRLPPERRDQALRIKAQRGEELPPQLRQNHDWDRE